MDELMSVAEQIEYRNELLNRASKGEKLSLEERQWLVTNPVYNRKLGPPYTNYEIITLPTTSSYRLIVKIEKVSYEDRVVPIISVPNGKGKILCDFPVRNIKGATSVGKPIKMLGLESAIATGETCVEYQSELGIVAVEYKCDYFDEKQNIYIRKSSSTGDYNFAMLKEQIKHNKFIFHCKNPKAELDAIVFTVEFETTKNKRQGTVL